MLIKFLGTAAAEGFPAVFCNCASCKAARAGGGKNIRTRNQILINGDLLLDFPMDTYFHSISGKLDLSGVEQIFITHAHMDHCYAEELAMHGAPYAHNMTFPILSIYGSKTVIKKVKRNLKAELKPEIEKSLRFNKIAPYDIIRLKNYTVTALPAVHTKNEDCLIYLIEDGEKTYLQFNDSGILPDSVYDYLAAADKKIDLVSFDCTYGYFQKGKGRHMGVLDNAGEREKMMSRNIVNADTKYILTHFSHNGGMLHDEMCGKVKDLNFVPAFDGMEVKI
jgi:phosphoribosyl 1,2-cyclic phosphate phosphodiesterase